MPSKYFRLTAPVPVVLAADPTRRLLTVPRGALVSLAEEPQDAGPFVNVVWEGQTVAMYAKDLMEHGALVRTFAGG